MKTSTIFWGTFLVSLGISLIAVQQEWINIDWTIIRDYWSVFLILCGIAILASKSKMRWIVTATTAAMLGLGIASTSSHGFEYTIHSTGKEWHILDDKDFEFDNSDHDASSDDESDEATVDSTKAVQPKPETADTATKNAPGADTLRTKKQTAIY